MPIALTVRRCVCVAFLSVALFLSWAASDRAIAQVRITPTAHPAPAVDPKIEARAKEWLWRLQTGRLDRSQLNARSNAAATPALIKDAAATYGPLGPATAFSFLTSYTEVGPVTHARYLFYSFLATFRERQSVFQLVLDGNGKIAGIFILPYTPHLSANRLLPALRAELLKDTNAGQFSGAVMVAKDGKAVFDRAYGLADRGRRIPNTVGTRFRIGSMNKMFTAVAVLQLVQAGKIDLKAPLGTYLTAYPNKDVSSRVTIHQLLTHTGGTGDIFGPEFDAHRLQLRTLDDYVNLYGKRGLAFKPGSRYEYSNYGYILLGVVIEKVSGQSYYDYVREHIYDPAGMTSTGSEAEDQMLAGRSVGYTAGKGTLVANTDTLPYRGTSAGGGYSTVDDLLRFANALEYDKLLDALHTQLLTTGKVSVPSTSDNPRHYAYGFMDQEIGGTRCFGHDGGAPGMNGDLEICPAAGYVIAVLANMDPPAAELISGFITNSLPSR
ncbi:MAG TPA: serine hydrolase domain-containing protein [Candidatus Baltobacteraceae bacterium]